MVVSEPALPIAEPGSSPESRLLRIYNRTVGATYALLVLGLAAFFAFQVSQHLEGEIQRIQSRFERHGEFMEFVLAGADDQVKTLRSALIALRTPLACRAGGHEAAGRSADFQCDLGAALALAPQLTALATQAPSIAGARFFSVYDFQVGSPWPSRHTPDGGMPASAREVLRTGRSGSNPGHDVFWSAPYFAGRGIGLLVPVAAPVYADGRFMGVVALEIRIDFFNRLNGAIGDDYTAAAVVDAQGRVLAHPLHMVDPLTARQLAHVEQAFAPEVLASVQELARIPPGEPVHRAGSIIIRYPFTSAPWQMVYVVPQAAVWRKLLFEQGPAIAFVLVSLGLLLAFIHAATWYGFIGPAARLVHRMTCEPRPQTQPAQWVPPVWRPWFESTAGVLRKSLELGSLRREVDIAARLQQAILPRQWPSDPRFELWGTMKPARDIGGDFFDHFLLPQGQQGLVVADVSGKGIPAGLFGMVCKTLLRAVATQRDHDPGEIARAVNEALCADNDSSMFVTTLYGQYDPASGRLVYANAGHPPPLVVRSDGSLEWLARSTGPAFGVVAGSLYGQARIDLLPGDVVLFFTDGVTESVDARGMAFGTERLLGLFQGRPTSAARDAIERVLAHVGQFAGGVEQFDDIACVALRCRALGASCAEQAGGAV